MLWGKYPEANVVFYLLFFFVFVLPGSILGRGEFVSPEESALMDDFFFFFFFVSNAESVEIAAFVGDEASESPELRSSSDVIKNRGQRTIKEVCCPSAPFLSRHIRITLFHHLFTFTLPFRRSIF